MAKRKCILLLFFFGLCPHTPSKRSTINSNTHVQTYTLVHMYIQRKTRAKRKLTEIKRLLKMVCWSCQSQQVRRITRSRGDFMRHLDVIGLVLNTVGWKALLPRDNRKYNITLQIRDFALECYLSHSVHSVYLFIWQHYFNDNCLIFCNTINKRSVWVFVEVESGLIYPKSIKLLTAHKYGYDT